jgi:hypothetical protein
MHAGSEMLLAKPQNRVMSMHAKYNRSTEEYGKARGVTGSTVRRRYSTTGSYFGDIPIRLPNGRLAWPGNEPEHSNSADAAVNRRAAKALAARMAKRGDKAVIPDNAMTSENDNVRGQAGAGERGQKYAADCARIETERRAA